MDKFTRLKEHHLEARKTKDLVASNLLGTLKGEVETEQKTSEEVAEKIVERLAKKFKKGLQASPTDTSEQELEILKVYLPVQLDESEIISELNLLGIKEIDNFGEQMNIAMKSLKGKADGNLIARIIRSKF